MFFYFVEQSVFRFTNAVQNEQSPYQETESEKGIDTIPCVVSIRNKSLLSSKMTSKYFAL